MASNEPSTSTSGEKEETSSQAPCENNAEPNGQSSQKTQETNVDSVKFKVPLPVVPLPTFHFKYNNRKFDLNSLFDERKADKRTLLDDKVIDFYLNTFIDKIRIGEDEETRKSIKFYDSFFFECLKKKFDSVVKNPPKRSDLAELHRKMFRKPDMDIVEKDLLVIPVHIKYPKHWVLVLVHNTKGAIRLEKQDNKEDTNNNENNLLSNLTGSPIFEIKDQGQCRILIMDSLIHSPKFKDLLKKHHESVSKTIKLWLQMSVAVLRKEFMINRTRVILCRNLPKQNNSVDCGLYLLTYAEYFIHWNTDWMDWPTDDLEDLEIDEVVEMSMRSEQIRTRLQELIEYMASDKRNDPVTIYL